jgi:class 3 adenylate cyclase
MNCPGCGRSNRRDASFCDRCGGPLTGALAAADARDPGAYTPRHLAEKILTQRSALEGERKQVTVLFVDIQSSMELAEEVDPEEWHRILDRFFAILADGIHRFEGTVNQYTGDGIMALFGAPIAHEDHAQRACYAALHLAREVRRYAQRLRREQGLDFGARMGLNSGEVVVGRIGDDLRMDYTAQGQTVGLAARMEKLAETGKVYLTAHTAALVSGYFELEDLGEFNVRGMTRPVSVYALQDVGALRTRLDVARSRGFSRFVGRTTEITRLEGALERAAAGQGRLVDMVADPGVGKSRLCYEFAEGCRARGIPVFTGRGVSHGRSIPLLPVLEFLREAFEIADGDDALRARRKIAGALLLADRDFADDLPLIFDLLGVADPDQPDPLVEGEGRERRVFAMLRRFLEARTDADPIVVLLEDLHWFDRASVGFVEELLQEIDASRTLVVANYRPDFAAPWSPGPNMERIALGPLGAEDIDLLLADLLGDDSSLASVLATIRSRAGGNPFFVEEVVQSLLDTGALSGGRGAHHLARPVDEIAIPSTVQALISSRIDRLGERDKLLLDTAAVIGREFSEPVLRSVAQLADDEFAASVSALLQGEFILEDAVYPERSFAFKHPLTREVAYQSQLSDQRNPMHAAVARALEESLADALDENAGLIAHHWEQAGNALAAARFVHRAARRIGPSNPSEAMVLWRKLMDLLEDTPRSAETAFLVARACRWLLFLASSQGMPPEEAEHLLNAGRAYSEQTRDRRSLALTLANYAYYQAQIAVAPHRSVEFAREALRIAKEHKNPALELTIGVRLAQALQFWGRFAEATSLGRDILSRLAEPGAGEIDPLDHVTLYSTVGDSLNELGHPSDGVLLIEAGLELAAERDLTLNAGFCHNAYVRAVALFGEAAKAETHALAAMRAAERTGNKAMLVYAYDVMNLAHQQHARWTDAVECGQRAVELSDAHGVAKISENAHRAHLSHAYLRNGQLEPARRMAESAVEVSRRCGPRYTPRAHLAMSRVLLETSGTREQIEAHLAAAQAAINETGARVYEPFIFEDRSRLASRVGDADTRRRMLQHALQRYTEMSLPVPAQRIQRALS